LAVGAAPLHLDRSQYHQHLFAAVFYKPCHMPLGTGLAASFISSPLGVEHLIQDHRPHRSRKPNSQASRSVSPPSTSRFISSWTTVRIFSPPRLRRFRLSGSHLANPLTQFHHLFT
jgi:hypothetical protein